MSQDLGPNRLKYVGHFGDVIPETGKATQN